MKPIEKFKLIESMRAIIEEEGLTRRDLAYLTGLSEQNLCTYLNGSNLPTGARLQAIIGLTSLSSAERAYRLPSTLLTQSNFGESVESSTHQLLLELTARVEKLEGLTLKTSFFGKSLTKQG